jgi:3-hydroxyisobutyrate dehydrogenase
MTTDKLKVGFIGLGNMGAPMTRRLLQAGFEVTVWNRSAAKMQPLLDAGASAAEHAAGVMQVADITGICLLDTASVEALTFGPAGLVEGAQGSSGKIVLDFTTIDPEATKRIATKAREQGAIAWIDAPVSGGVAGAEQGTLSIFTGGDAADIERAKPYLDAVAGRVTHMGPSGAGQMTKMCNQLIVSVSLLTIAETVAMARRAGVDVSKLTQALQGGFADSKPLQIFGPRMVNHTFEPLLGEISIMLKDLDMVQQVARTAGAATPVSALASALYRSAGTRPDIDLAEDISALIKLYETR